MWFQIYEIKKHKDMDLFEMQMVQVFRKKGKFKERPKEAWEIRILTPLNPIHHPNPQINDILKVSFDPKYTFNTKTGEYEKIEM